MPYITVNEKRFEVDENATYEQVAAQAGLGNEILLAKVDNSLKELTKVVQDGDNITFLDGSSAPGYQTYKRSINLLLCKAVRDVLGVEAGHKIRILHSVGKAYFYEIGIDGITVNAEIAAKIQARMEEMVAQDVKFEKYSMHTSDVIEYFEKEKMYDKANLIRYRRSSRTNVYRIGDYQDYFYGYMVPSAKRLKCFKVDCYEQYLILVIPRKENPGVLPVMEYHPKLLKVLEKSKDWSKTMKVSHVGDLNELIVHGDIHKLILVQEALQENLLYKIARDIDKQNKRIILIAGPSSSGKTTFSHRLAIQLSILGLNPHPIALDDFFKDRTEAPKDENGEYDFESIKCLDVDLFTKCINGLLAGEEVIMPYYDFVAGTSERNKETMQIGKHDVLIIEGIHGLNGSLTSNIGDEYKYKIYVSALTQLALDKHNRIPTTDARLIRRIVRDARTRGADAQSTIARWHSVRAGEEKNIFPYQEEADAMFNSAQVYELAVLKQYAEPLLFAVPRDSEEYIEAKRLLKFFDYFLNIPSEDIPTTSIIREFIGGGCFKV